MTINVSNITPNMAILRATILLQSMADLRKEDDSVDILSLYLEGEPGVGKSTVAKRIARNLGAKMFDIRANNLSPDVAAGVTMMDMDTKTTVWMPPYWLPAEDGSDGPVVLFFDELASADDRVRKPLFSVFLDRELNGRKIPDNCFVIGAGNESETGTMVFELDNATRTRFVNFRIIADFTSWVEEFAPEAKVTPTTIAYLKANIHNFCNTEKALSAGLALYGQPRSWHHVSNMERSIMRTPEDRNNKEKKAALQDSASGKVGTELAIEYMAAFENVAQMSNLYDILRALPEDRKKMWPKNLGQLYALSYSMMAYPIDIKTGREIADLLKEMPDDSDLPFADSKTPIIEVILKRLKAAGIRDSEISKAFKEDSAASVEELLANGPLIKCGI